PGVLVERPHLGAVQCPTHLRGLERIYFIKAFGDCVVLLPVQELRQRSGVQLTPRHPEPARRSLSQAEEVVRYGHSDLDSASITGVILKCFADPTPSHTLPARRGPTGCAYGLRS